VSLSGVTVVPARAAEGTRSALPARLRVDLRLLRDSENPAEVFTNSRLLRLATVLNLEPGDVLRGIVGDPDPSRGLMGDRAALEHLWNTYMRGFEERDSAARRTRILSRIGVRDGNGGTSVIASWEIPAAIIPVIVVPRSPAYEQAVDEAALRVRAVSRRPLVDRLTRQLGRIAGAVRVVEDQISLIAAYIRGGGHDARGAIPPVHPDVAADLGLLGALDGLLNAQKLTSPTAHAGEMRRVDEIQSHLSTPTSSGPDAMRGRTLSSDSFATTTAAPSPPVRSAIG
jgi:hypothetical protein